MKKRTTKSTKPAKVAPAAASSSNADVKPVRKAPAPLVASTPAVKPAPKAPAPVAPVVKPAPKEPAPVVASEPVAKPAPKVPAKKPAPKPTSTKIAAQIDVGFGNTLYIRGEGPGLSWDRGLAMDCVADDLWSITLSEATLPVSFKLLLNDITWCAGEDYVVAAGGSATVTPSF